VAIRTAAHGSGGGVTVRVVGLSKSYRISHLERLFTIRDSVQRLVTQPAERLRALVRRSEAETIWALKDVSFELGKGEVLGIVGRNGAGKSTLLKILSRITEPTEGYADISGRLASLLEVGTGFHPELTGRDNIFLNGAILGMRRGEIASKFEEIVEFAGVEKFIDTPVKRYSSGMYMRLGFAVAAHLDPDILVVDEILSVGDQEFQRKSLGKMREVTGEGRTILFVSHNMAAIRSLCDRAIMLDKGRVVASGDVETVVTTYLENAEAAGQSGAAEIPKFRSRKGTAEARFTHVQVLDDRGRSASRLYLGQPFTIAMTFDAGTFVNGAIFEVGISTLDGIRVATAFSTDGGEQPWPLPTGRAGVALELDVGLMPGRYAIDLAMHHSVSGWTIDVVDRVLEFETLNTAESGGDRLPHTSGRGFIRAAGRWRAPESEAEEDAAVESS
jgi:lipopolysaccharide transport system ATP-binding protein